MPRRQNLILRLFTWWRDRRQPEKNQKNNPVILNFGSGDVTIIINKDKD